MKQPVILLPCTDRIEKSVAERFESLSSESNPCPLCGQVIQLYTSDMHLEKINNELLKIFPQLAQQEHDVEFPFNPIIFSATNAIYEKDIPKTLWFYPQSYLDVRNQGMGFEESKKHRPYFLDIHRDSTQEGTCLRLGITFREDFIKSFRNYLDKMGFSMDSMKENRFETQKSNEVRKLIRLFVENNIILHSDFRKLNRLLNSNP